MKLKFIEARYIGKYAKTDEIKKNLEESLKNIKNIFLGSSIQFLDILDKIKKILEKLDKNVIIITGKHSSIEGQILGCDIYSSNKILENKESKGIILNDSCFIIISTGEFHALSGVLAEAGNQKIMETYSLNPIDGKIKKLENKFPIKGAYLKFLDSKNIGILITTKPGQNDEKDIDELIKKFPEKKFYKIISDFISPQSLEDFNYIDFFINTACPRMIDDRDNFTKKIINISNLLDTIEKYSEK